MLNGMQQCGIEAAEPSQRFRLDAVVFARTRIDEAELSGIGHQHLVAQAGEEAAHPWRVGADFEDHAAAGPRGEHVLKGHGGGAGAAGLEHLTVGIHHTVVGMGIAEIEADC